MSYYPEPDSHIRDKVKVVVGLSNYATKKELKDATGVDTPHLAAKRDFIAFRINLLNNFILKKLFIWYN